MSAKSRIYYVTPVHNHIYNGIKCLESVKQYGFFKDEIDIRPSSCTWIDKEVCDKLYLLFHHKRIE